MMVCRPGRRWIVRGLNSSSGANEDTASFTSTPAGSTLISTGATLTEASRSTSCCLAIGTHSGTGSAGVARASHSARKISA